MAGVRDMVDLSSDAAFAISPQLRVVTWNREAERITGVSATSAIGRRCGDVLRAVFPGGEPLCGPACHGGTCLSHGTPFAVRKCLVQRSDGSQVQISLSTMIIPDYGASSQCPDICALVFLHQPDGTGANPAYPQPLRIYALGHFGLVLNGRHVPLERWARRSALGALKRLAAQSGRAIHYESLIESLWPGVAGKPGRDRLKVVIHCLRKQLAVDGLIASTDEGYALCRNLVWIDAGEFERFAREGVHHLAKGSLDEAVASFENAVKIYRGDYFEESPYDDWCAEERGRLREMFFDTAYRLADTLVRMRRFDAATDVCRLALARESCREGFHCILMACLLEMGRLDEAELQFRRCRDVLARDLAVEPLPETLRLYQRIRRARDAGR
jgi:DNA-binding SARP family transcriptional activator